MFHFRTHKSPYLVHLSLLRPISSPNSGQMLFSLTRKWSFHNTLMAQSSSSSSSSSSFFQGGGGGLVFVKASACTSFILPLSWKYTTERPFFLTVSFQDYIISSMALYYNIISYVFFLPGPTLTIEGTCIQLSSGVRIFWSRSRSALPIGFPFTGKDTVWHLWDPKNRSNRNKNVYGDLL